MKNLKINSFKKYFKRFLYLLKYFISFRCSQKPINKGFKDYLKQVFTTLKQVYFEILSLNDIYDIIIKS